MSSGDDESINQNDSEHIERVVADAVHSRFRPVEVHCEICNVNIVGNYSAIDRHFQPSHPSKEYCTYCKGKVFVYIQMPIDDSIEQPKTVVFHKCNKS